MDSEPILYPPKCGACSNDTSDQDQFCTSCGFPLKGSEVEQQLFLGTRRYKQHQMHDLRRRIKNAQTTLYVLAGLFLVMGVLFYFISGQDDLSFAALIQTLILAGIFLALGGWAKSKPVVALISGLVLFILVQLIAIVEDPANIVKGIIIKIVVIVYLVRGLLSAIEAEKIRKEHNLT